MTGLVIRALGEHDAHLFHALPDPGLVGRARFGHTYATLAQGGEYRPEWTWVALRGERVVARAAWWGGPDDTAPKALDWFDFADGEADAGARLLRAAPLHAEYNLLAPPGWRADPELRAAVRSRADAAVAGGLTPLVERYRYEWTPADGLPPRPGRLVFRPEPDDTTVAAVLRRVLVGTLDAHDRRVMATGGPDAAVEENMELLHWLPSPREWWRLAHTPAGELVGIHVPARNPSAPCVAYVGVVPEQRGHGYAFDLLAECTHDLVGYGAERIVAATDRGNTPMAAHFARAGYPVAQERLDFV
ncbi:GNAT family N-acetyltransferase [Streptomyces pactum]|uniref:GNAT family N-acetyltransferase n=1 Tax=Streptomyces pactum TaxID=68249 RepID=A0ABS0NR53_9ACTN|nr:GNAT family N-acetyltransferase [Streptomyces pactum]MBH5337519.1 GNAT family N-acetyltransferase [Streptomyces pactum]